MKASDFINSDCFQSVKALGLEILLTLIVLNTQQLSYICNFGSAYIILAVTVKSESTNAPPCIVLLRRTVVKIKKEGRGAGCCFGNLLSVLT